MRFPTLKSKLKHFEREICLDGGINTVASPMAMGETEVCECENMFYKDKLLKTRKGFYTDENMILDEVTGYESPKKPFTFLNESFVIDSKECRIGYTITWDVVSFAYLNTFLIFSDGTIKKIEPISFNRVDDTTFFLADSISVFKAQKKTGCGIYLFCYLKNHVAYSSETDCRIYELDSDGSYWQRLFESDYYIPTVCYNGRGNLFGESAISDDPLYEKPCELESQSLLTSAFYSYFSADGTSDSFQLPLSDLDDKPVVCTLSYKNGGEYTWIISGNEKEIDFLTTKVTAKCNRKTGIISFYQGGNPYGLPLYTKGNVNNIKVLAYKKINNGLLNVASSLGALNYNSNVIVYGNANEKNRIYTAKTDNPLYFPKDSFCDVGISTESVTSIKTLGDNLVAFTQSAIYSLSLKTGDVIASTELISGVDKTFFKPDKIAAKQLTAKTGCIYPESIKLVGDNLIFKGVFNVYVMNKSGNVCSLSYPVSAELYDEKTTSYGAVGFVYKGFYGVKMLNKMYLVDIENMKIQNGNAISRWYFWSLPDDMKFNSAANFSNEPVFCFSDSKERIYYLSKLSGDKDISFEFSKDASEKHLHKINGFFKTAFIDFDGIKIEGVDLNIGATGDIEILVDSYYSRCNFKKKIALNDSECEQKILKKVKVYPSLKADSASIKVIGEAPFYIGKLKFLYR